MNNVEDTYEAIVETSKELALVTNRLSSCMVVGLIRKPFSLPRGWLRQVFLRDLLSSKVSSNLRTWMEESSPQELRAHRLYRCVIADHSFKCVANLAIATQRLSPADVKRLKALHAFKLEQIKNVDVKPLLVGLTGLGAVVSKTLPKEIFEYFQWNYALFQVVSTGVLLGLLLYLALTLSPMWLQHLRATRVHQTIGFVLTYCEIVFQERETDSNNEGSNAIGN